MISVIYGFTSNAAKLMNKLIPFYKQAHYTAIVCHALENFYPSKALVMRSLRKLLEESKSSLLIYDITKSNSDLELFHMNINSLQFYFDESETFFVDCPINFKTPGKTLSLSLSLSENLFQFIFLSFLFLMFFPPVAGISIL